MLGDDLTAEARLDAVELLLREMLGFRPPIERINVVTRVGALVTALEAEAIRSQDPARRGRAADVRVAMERLTARVR